MPAKLARQARGDKRTTEAYYSFDYANIHFICLDSEESPRTVAGAMLTWLANDLASTTQPWIIAFWHTPPYTKGSHDSDNAGDSGGRMRDMRQNANPILENGGVDLVLGGHSHSYERSYLIDGHYGLSSTFVPATHIKQGGDGRPSGNGAYTKATLPHAPHEGTVYTVAGSSGQASGGSLNHPAMFISLNQLGSMILDVNGNRLDATFLRSTGVVTDTFTIIKGGAGSPTPSVTPSATPSSTASQTPSVSPTASQTASQTPLVSPTASQTASMTASVSPTASQTASMTASPSESLSPSPSASPTGTGTSSPTATSTATSTPNLVQDWLIYE